ncbi:MAG: glycosyltransferase family 1 protein, partial [Acidobacteriaceae bacterium]
MSLPRKRRILYIGNMDSGMTSAQRAKALARLGQDIIPFNLRSYHPRSRLVAGIRYYAPVGPLIRRVNRDLIDEVRRQRPDVVWFEKPIVFTPATVRTIRATGAVTVCYNLDNPFGPRNDRCWYQFK